MTEEESLVYVIESRMEQAENSLATARLVLDAGYACDAANRLYYAMFYSVLALLALRGLGTSKHKSAIELFSREFVKQGVFPKSYARRLHEVFELRLKADYDNDPQVEVEVVNKSLTEAREFIDSVRQYLSPQIEKLRHESSED